MNKLMALIAALTCILGLTGCQKTVDASTVYEFPEPTIQISGSFCSQGIQRTFVIGPEEYDPDCVCTAPVMSWLNGLEVRECEEPQPVEGDAYYEFSPDGRPGFTYVDRGSEAFLIVDGTWYQVTNPSAPPLEWKEDGKTEETASQVRFGDNWINEANLSQETLEWLDWYNSLPEEEQLAVSAIPADLLEESGISGTEDAAAATD